MVSKLNIYNFNLKHFGRIRYPLNQYIFNLKSNQGLNSCELVWKSSNTKNNIKNSFKCVMISYFNIYTVHLKCFASIRYNLNQYKTLTKNFNQGLNNGELVWKMAKSKHQKQH